MNDVRGGLRVIVTGANRGLGLEFSRQFLAAGDRVVALARDPGSSTDLDAIARAHPDTLTVGRVDVADDALIRAARAALPPSWGGVDVLINNAGTYGSKDPTLETLEIDELHRLFDINATGPIRMTRAFLAELRRGSSPRIVNITSLMGSIKDNTSGGAWAYRVSKTALNMVTRNMAHELAPRGVITVAMHPGWVRTDMGGPNAPLSIHDAVTSMVATIRSLDMERAGAFLDRDGHHLPW
jgi:NAD(P)-dependent dehydrogenase (short-subunit alcohol dehydrogenase family)